MDLGEITDHEEHDPVRWDVLPSDPLNISFGGDIHVGDHIAR
jgi:hypothetical protein